MSKKFRKNVLWQLTLSAWGMVTLVLLFCVILLANELSKSGENPFGALKPEQAAAPAARETRRPEQTLGPREITLFFADTEGGALTGERDSVDFSDSTALNCRAALDKLIAGPRDMLTPILPPSVHVRGIYLLGDGELVVDFSGEIVSQHLRFTSALMETLLVQGVANTLTQEALRGESDGPVRRVRFLFEGAQPEESYPAHIDLSKPIQPDPVWIGGGGVSNG